VKKYFVRFQVLITMFLFFNIHSAALGCTIWASIGSVNRSRGVFLVKNRDAEASGIEVMRIVHPEKGNEYFGLLYNHHVDSKKFPYISAGINREGLSVVNASIMTVHVKNRDKGESILIRKLLTKYSSVHQVLNHAKKIFSTGLVNNLLLADKHEIADIEIGPKGHYMIRHKKNGVIAHTNQYEYGTLCQLNKWPFKNGKIRLHTINSYLKPEQRPFTYLYFLKLTNLRQHGLHNSIFRQSTLATIIFNVRLNNATKVYVRFSSPRQKQGVFNYVLNKKLWSQQ